MRWLVLLVAACGAPAPAQAPARPVVVATPPAPITCGEVGVILRGAVEDERDAGPMKEAAIAKACLHDEWTSDVIACIGGKPNAKACLDELSKEQLAAYREKLARWHDDFPDEVFEEEFVDDDHLDYVDCADGIGDVASYAPALTHKGPDRELALAMRRQHVLALCEDWSTPVRQCFESGKPSEQCRNALEPDQKQDVIDRLAEVDALMQKIVALEPAATCKKVVHEHYGNARWKGKLDGLKPAEKKQMIVESRARMTKACTDENWSTTVRGCIVVGGGDACFVGKSASLWGYPAIGIPIKTGIPECDSYGDALRALLACTAIPRQAPQTMLERFQIDARVIANTAGARRTEAANSCKKQDLAIRQSAASLGCTF